jgi:trk system potassium uptake protein
LRIAINLKPESRLRALVRTPQTIVIAGFAAVILLGALVLRHPWSHGSETVGFVDALFTSTSAVCVTGLTVVDTGTRFTTFGHVVIMLLIQAGGLGVMTFAAVAFQLSGRRLSLKSRAMLHDSFFQRDFAAQFHSAFKTILYLTFVIEGLGAVVLFLSIISRMEASKAVFLSLFHSVSAFCNAGFSLWSDNLLGIRDNALFLSVIMLLIVFGGLGYTVLSELWRRLSSGLRKGCLNKPLSIHARLVLFVTGFLIVGGTLALLIFGLTAAETGLFETFLNALFQSVTARTAGFNSIDIGKLPSASLTILIILMFVGGSPGSCAGGIKTTSAAIWMAGLRATLAGKTDVEIFDRRISHDLISRTDLLIGLAFFWNLAGILILFGSEAGLKVSALDLVFEQISAFGTVGLSTGLTPDLSVAGKLWLSATMFVGRLGPLTIAVLAFPANHVNIRYPKGSVMIG